MRSRLALASLATALLASACVGDIEGETPDAKPPARIDAATLPPPADAPPAPMTRDTFTTSGKDILDSCGNPFVPRGINHPTIFVDRAGAALPEIAKTKANIVRLFWFAGQGVAITEAESAIKAATDNGMVAMLEVHDTTCGWTNLAAIKSYWT